MYSKTKHFIRKNTIFFVELAVILILISGSASATVLSVQNVHPTNGGTVGTTINFQCNVIKGDNALGNLYLYVDGVSTKTQNAFEGINTFSTTNVAVGSHTYNCIVYDEMGNFYPSEDWSFTAEMLCEECTYPECYGWCPPGLVCRGIGGFPTPPEGVCECVPDITTTTTIEDTTTTVEDTTTTVEDTTTTIPAVPEFASLTVALIILLTTPAFAYLLVKKRK